MVLVSSIENFHSHLLNLRCPEREMVTILNVSSWIGCHHELQPETLCHITRRARAPKGNMDGRGGLQFMMLPYSATNNDFIINLVFGLILPWDNITWLYRLL